MRRAIETTLTRFTSSFTLDRGPGRLTSRQTHQALVALEGVLSLCDYQALGMPGDANEGANNEHGPMKGATESKRDVRANPEKNQGARRCWADDDDNACTCRVMVAHPTLGTLEGYVVAPRH